MNGWVWEVHFHYIDWSRIMNCLQENGATPTSELLRKLFRLRCIAIMPAIGRNHSFPAQPVPGGGPWGNGGRMECTATVTAAATTMSLVYWLTLWHLQQILICRLEWKHSFDELRQWHWAEGQYAGSLREDPTHWVGGKGFCQKMNRHYFALIPEEWHWTRTITLCETWNDT